MAKLQNTGPLLEQLQNAGSINRVARWLVSQFKEVFLEWLGGSFVNATGEPPSRRTTRLYTFLVLLNTRHDWRAVEPPSH